MSNPINTDIMGTIKVVLDDLLNALGEEEKTTVRDLIDKIVSKTGVKVSIANGVVPMLLQTWEEEGKGQVRRGRNGGVSKGKPKVRIDPRPRCGECNQVLRPGKKI